MLKFLVVLYRRPELTAEQFHGRSTWSVVNEEVRR
jgi:hypothetical protein